MRQSTDLETVLMRQSTYLETRRILYINELIWKLYSCVNQQIWKLCAYINQFVNYVHALIDCCLPLYPVSNVSWSKNFKQVETSKFESKLYRMY